jgi:iron complex outermembrane receptor protein
MRFHISSLSLSILAVMTTAAFAQGETQETASSQVLPTLQFEAQDADDKAAYAAKQHQLFCVQMHHCLKLRNRSA